MGRHLKLKLELHEKLGFLREPHRYKVAHGGRGGGKSYGYADALLLRALEQRQRILCTREFQVSIADSVHHLLKTRIEALAERNPRVPIRDFFDVQQRTIRTTNGSEFIFAGIKNNIGNIRSKEAIDVAWVEEAQSISNDSWEVLIPTIRKPGSEIWVTLNRYLETDPTDVRFIKNPPPGAVVRQIGWQNNPWISAELIAEKDYLYSVDPEAAAHVWGGDVRKRSKAEVLSGKWVVEPFEPQPEWFGPYQGIDFGFSPHPSCLVRLWISGEPQSLERELWIEWEAYGVGVDNDELPALFDKVPDARKYKSRADSSRPETISHLNRHGYPKVEGAPKWQGSVEDGIAHLRGYKRIVIHPRCTHTIDEAKLWSWKTDPLTGDVLPILIDLHNHCWDAARYALAPVIRRRDLVFI